MLPMLACIIASMWMISMVSSVWVLLAAGVVGAFGYGAVAPVPRSIAMGLVPEYRCGSASGTLYLGSDLGQFAGPICGGVLATSFGC